MIDDCRFEVCTCTDAAFALLANCVLYVVADVVDGESMYDKQMLNVISEDTAV
jgi:hypothetical protein